ncbi:MAG: hypothetical protein CMH12_21985 [Maritimibacter sp.]|nr:hypothetical protein [Maritimibacter sp.]
MTRRCTILLVTCIALGACSSNTSSQSQADTLPPLPEEVILLAAPNQNLVTAHLRPEDNCYWYMHSGPVETTALPLRTVNGNPICLQRSS